MSKDIDTPVLNPRQRRDSHTESARVARVAHPSAHLLRPDSIRLQSVSADTTQLPESRPNILCRWGAAPELGPLTPPLQVRPPRSLHSARSRERARCFVSHVGHQVEIAAPVRVVTVGVVVGDCDGCVVVGVRVRVSACVRDPDLPLKPLRMHVHVGYVTHPSQLRQP